MSWLHSVHGIPRNKISWQILPYQLCMVRVSMDFEVKTRLQVLLKKNEYDLENEEQLISLLNGVWNNYKLRGAILIDAWDESIAELFDMDSQWKYRLTMLRPVSPLLVLNILGRARAGILLPHLPLSLAPQFLERDLVSTDQRLIQLVREESRNG